MKNLAKLSYRHVATLQTCRHAVATDMSPRYRHVATLWLQTYRHAVATDMSPLCGYLFNG